MTIETQEDETVGTRLRRLRIERQLSQRELACDGVSYAYISRIEAGTRDPSVKALRKLAAKLGVTAIYLETGTDMVCASLPAGVADLLFRDGARFHEDDDDFGLGDLAPAEQAEFEDVLRVALMRGVRSAGFAIRARREVESCP